MMDKWYYLLHGRPPWYIVCPIKGIKGKCQGTSLEKRVHTLTYANIADKA